MVIALNYYWNQQKIMLMIWNVIKNYNWNYNMIGKLKSCFIILLILFQNRRKMNYYQIQEQNFIKNSKACMDRQDVGDIKSKEKNEAVVS